MPARTITVIQASWGLSNIQASIDIHDEKTGQWTHPNISEVMHWKDALRFDVIGYYPYAEVQTDFVEDPAGDLTRVELSMFEEGELPECPGTCIFAQDLRNGRMSCECHPAVSGAATEAERQFLRLYKQLLQGKKPDQLITLVPSKLITRDNVNDYKGWQAVR